ncbi:Crp/Fnr family transcriptional regulator [Roseivirga misakiensis]|uniref:Crp/Fnr family transcriptional regulator n=1 Tax=Roseivirga misakiensis TaxID=1563681 RepID=A0A1E5SXX1_9BACT|nr:Crp/Fnr family transcriptional regulator [Roseivirga misakiensis]OEK03971.1 Crp/Fnr family transcriptional regulator [Roseivirga misakiensis]
MLEALEENLSQLGFEHELIQEILRFGKSKTVTAETSLINPGTPANAMPMVITGTLRIMREDEEGNEVFLYYLEGGDACAMSISCCMGNLSSPFKAISETDTTLWMVPLSMIDGWMANYSSFRKFVINSYQDRFDELMNTIDSIAFMNMDERLMKYLLDKKQSQGSFVIEKTHEQIAQELNTSRVVISRLLKKLEKEDKVELYRNRIEVL